jgi:hypothetical protein
MPSKRRPRKRPAALAACFGAIDAAFKAGVLQFELSPKRNSPALPRASLAQVSGESVFARDAFEAERGCQRLR